MAIYEDLTTPILLDILNHAEAALIENERPAVAHLQPASQVAWDNCCADGGQLYLRVPDIFPTGGPGTAFPQPDTRQACGVTMFGVKIALGTIRCASTIDDNNYPPTAATMTSEAAQLFADMTILFGVLNNEVHTLKGIHSLKVEKWTPIGPQGGCMSGEWTAFIAIDPGCQRP